MLDFQKLDQALELAVGATPATLLETASPTWAHRFFAARDRLSALSEQTDANPALVLERDRLASFFGCAYGDHGFLARAGVLHTLQAQLGQVLEALPKVGAEPAALGALVREATILRAFAEARLSNPKHPDDGPMLAQLDAAREALAALQQFAHEAAQATRSLGVASGAGKLYGLADLTNVASDFKEGLSVGGVISFVLGRLADGGFTSEARSLLHELCERHGSTLRDALWSAAVEGIERRGTPPTLAELRKLDLELETLKAELLSPRRRAADRAEAVRGLLMLVALARTTGAAQLAARMQDGALLLIAEGLANEGKLQEKRP